MSYGSDTNSAQIAYWNGEAGERWVRHQAQLDRMLGRIGAEVLAAAAVREGERVLDVGCGAGESSLRLAERVGKSGRVTGTDVSRPLLELARKRAGRDFPQLEFIEADASTHDFGAGTRGLLFSRFGVMFFADPEAAFARLRTCLGTGGRLAFSCWRAPQENEWVRLQMEAARAHLEPQPPADPHEPGPFAFADGARVRRILASAGFEAIELRPFDVRVEVGGSVEETVEHMQRFGPLSRALQDATPERAERAVQHLRESLAAHAPGSRVALGGATWIVTARNPT